MLFLVAVAVLLNVAHIALLVFGCADPLTTTDADQIIRRYYHAAIRPDPDPSDWFVS